MRSILPIAALLLASTLTAQNGTLDPGFGSGGIVTTSFGTGNIDEATDVIIQPDGKIIAVGYSADANTGLEKFSLARYQSNGALDNSFGVGGKVLSAVLTGYNCAAYAVELQADGKIVVAGHANDSSTTNPQNGYFAAARYHTNGALDSTFGINGVALFQVPATLQPEVHVTDMLMQPDSHFVICGGAYVNMVDGDMVFVRFDYNGAPDSSFGVSGISVQAPPAGGATPQAIALHSDGRIAVACLIDAGTHNDPMLTTLDVNGIVDQNFGSAGFIFPTYGFSSAFLGLTIQSDGKLVACGFGTNGAVVARFYDDGTNDNSFGALGTVIVPIGSSQDALFEDVLVQADGKILAAGMADVQFALVQLSASGALESTFGTGGIVQTAIGPGITDMAAAIEFQSDGKILLAGLSYSLNMNAPGVYALARYGNIITTVVPAETSNCGISLFPNPASDKATVELPGEGESVCSIYNSTGILITTSVCYGRYTEIDLGFLAAGVYTVVISNKSAIRSEQLVVVKPGM